MQKLMKLKSRKQERYKMLKLLKMKFLLNNLFQVSIFTVKMKQMKIQKKAILVS